MTIRCIKTHKIEPDESLINILDRYIPPLTEGSVVAVTSKVVALAEGRVVKIGSINKETLIEKEADRYLPAKLNQYGIHLTIVDNILIASAGIDESNTNGYYVLWPANPEASAQSILDHLKRRDQVKKLGIIITDSKTTPLRWGTTGFALTSAGFEPLKNYIGQPDIFGRPLQVTQTNLADGLAATAVLAMGEGNEQTPIAIISEPPVNFTDSQSEVGVANFNLAIDPTKDIYTELFVSPHWQEGKRSTF